MIRIIVVHQTKLIANIIGNVLSGEPDIHLVGTAVSVEEALGKIKLSNCNLVLVAATLPNNGALTITKAMSENGGQAKVLIIGVPQSEKIILEYVMAGASGYVLKDVPVDRLLENVRAVHGDKALVSPRLAAAMMHQVAELAQVSSQHALKPEAVSELSPREREVLNLIGDGLTNQEIAERLTIEVGTVKNHVHNILKKLDASNRHEAATYLPLMEEDNS
ncbi:MAG: response regulator transcription factor [Candidatus Promineifilaceae bacterium]